MKKNIQFVSIIITFVSILFLYNPSFIYAAMSGDSGNNKANLYKEAERFVLRAKKLEKKDKIEKALKLYSKAHKKLLKAYEKDKNNPDILNYLGFTLRKAGNFEEAEKFYIMGLKIKPEHKGINEYLGELYVETD